MVRRAGWNRIHVFGTGGPGVRAVNLHGREADRQGMPFEETLRNGVAVANNGVKEMSRNRPRNLNIGLGTTGP